MKTVVLWILILAIFIFGLAILSAPSREGFESSTKAPYSSNAKNAALERFKYFKMLPEDNKWSQETMDAFKVKYKEVNPNSTLTDEGIKILQKFGSEEEVKIYIETGTWPMNEYTKSNLKKAINSDPNIKEEDKENTYNMYLKSPFFAQPNSSLLFSPVPIMLVNGMTSEADIKGQVKFISKTMQGIDVDDSTKFNCSGSKALFNNQEITDYKDIEKIPGFKFLQSPCNPCSNRCPYSYEDVVLPPYAVYWGISSTSGKATPAAVMDDVQYKKCFEKANGKIVDMGGEPVECP
jgi:hypothetical protein